MPIATGKKLSKFEKIGSLFLGINKFSYKNILYTGFRNTITFTKDIEIQAVLVVNQIDNKEFFLLKFNVHSDENIGFRVFHLNQEYKLV